MTAGGADEEVVAAALGGLDARTWAQLLRALRRTPALPEVIAEALRSPASELADGAGRDELCALVADSPTVRDALRGDGALPAALHGALDAGGSGAQEEEEGAGVRDDAAHGDGSEQGRGTVDTSAERARALRRSLDDERRRREGAEARAASAEARAERASAEQDRLRTELAERTDELARAEATVDEAVARAERRSATRIAALEEELAAARGTAEGLRREQERTTVQLDALREELELLRARRPERPAAASDRPLVPPAELGEDSTAAARWLVERCALLLVDDYNVVLTLRPGQALEEQRRWLVERLRPLAARGLARPVVVFDGAGRAGGLRENGGVEVRFTAGGASADDEIVFEVAATDAPVLVVTDDAELRARVQAEGGNVVGIVHLAGIADA